MRPATSSTGSLKPTQTLGLQQLLRLLDRPIAFHRCFVKPTGSITAALMLSQAVYWQQRTKDPEGWWYKTREEWREETGMSRWEQEEARKRLRRVGVMREERRGIPARLWYQVDEVRLLELLGQPDQPTEPEPDPGPEGLNLGTTQMAGNPPSGRLEAFQPDGGKTSNWLATPQPTITETTTETTNTTTTTPYPSSTERAATTEPARGGRGDEDQKPEPQDGGQELATLETTKQNPVRRAEVQTAATTNKNSDTATEDQKTVASEAAIEAQRPELVFPAKLTEAEYQDIAAQVYPLPPEIAQQVLDVIESKRRSGQIKINPAALLRGILRKRQADPASFDPSIGFAVADSRRRRAEEITRMRAAAEQRKRERETLRITPQAREAAHRSLATMKAFLRGHAKET